MTMNAIIHAAVRRDLGRFEAALTAFPLGSPVRARQLARQLLVAWVNFDRQLTHHHEGEEHVFWPALRELGVPEAMLGEMDGEHERMAQALASTRAAITALAGVMDEAGRSGAVLAARGALVQLRERVEAHFEHEERELEPVFARSLDTPLMKRAVSTIRRSLGPADTGMHFAWLQHGADPDAAAVLRATMPAPVLFVLSKVLGRRYWKQIAPTWD